MLGRIGTLCLLAALAGMTGCAYVQNNPPLHSAGADLTVASDLPVPEGFRMDRSASWRHERSSYRRLRLRYWRPEYLSRKRVAEFLLKAYPKAGWKPEFVYGLNTTRMVFLKGREECDAAVREDFGNRFTELWLEVKPQTTPDGEVVAEDSVSSPEAAHAKVAAPHPRTSPHKSLK